ncbi:MAG: PAS domain S-box protein, partial [bacterium]|nr:PAS domain S-box protein [bacterium]
ITLFNKGAERIFGYTVEEALGQPLDILLPERFAQSHRDHVQDFAASPVPSRMMSERETLSGLRKDGTEFPVEISISKLELGGEIVFTAILRDVTERKRAEEEIRKHRDRLEELVAERTAELDKTTGRLESLIESSSDAIIVTDRDGEVILFNKGAEDLSGYRREEAIGRRTPLLYASEEDAKGVMRLMREGDGTVSAFETTFRAKDGTLMPVLISASLLYDEEGREAGTVGISKDLRERKRTEDELRLLQTTTLAVSEAEDFYSALDDVLRLVCETTDWVLGEAWVPSADGTRLKCSPAWHCGTGGLEAFRAGSKWVTFEPGEGLPGRAWSSREPVWVTDVTSPDFAFKRREVALEAGFKAGMAVPITTGDEVVAVMNFFVFEPREEDERLLGLVSTVAAQLGTVMQRKRAEEALIQSEKMASLGRLTAGVSHEILNPLNIISVSHQLMLDDPATPQATAQQLDILQGQVHRITKITQDLLSFSRQREPERSTVDVNEVVTQTLGLIESGLRLDNIEVEMRLAEDLPPISADHGQLQQMVLNLLTNARDAMPNGGRLSIRTGTVLNYGRRFVELQVEDTGDGIAPEHMDKLFDPFFTTKPEGEGTGLGLSICQGIIGAHEGVISAENVPDGGAVFIVHLNVGGE